MQVSDQPLPDDVEYIVWIWSDQTPDRHGTPTRNTYLNLSEDRWLIDELGGTEFSWYVQVAQLIPTDNDSSTLKDLSPESETRTFRLGTGTPANSAVPSAEDAASTISTDAPTILSPLDGSAFDQNAIVLLEWTPVKPQLADDELYMITIHFEHTDQIWTDKAWTRNTSWHLNEHRYLLDVATGSRFEWSVQLIRQTGEDESGVPTGDALSPSSAARVFYWARTTSGGSSGGSDSYPNDNGGGSDDGTNERYP